MQYLNLTWVQGVLPQSFPTTRKTRSLRYLNGVKRDVVWAILDSLPGKSANSDIIGSWTAFNKVVSNVAVKKSLLEYLPVIPEPPEYPVCKAFLDSLLELMKELEIGHIFAHADEQVYARLCHIIWKYP